MTTFDKQAIPGQTFLYQKGTVTTVKPWGRPSYQKVRNFLTYLNQHTEILNNYDVYLTGGVLFDFNTTWDLDLCLVGGIQTDTKLEEDLNYLTNLSLNTFNMLLDVSWYESKPPNLTYDKIVNDNFFSHDIMYKTIGYIKKQIGENIQETDYRILPNMILLSEYLVQNNHGHHNRPENITSKVQNNTKPETIMSFSANEFLSTDEEYFLNNTNR
jgi:hypothetical protein